VFDGGGDRDEKPAAAVTAVGYVAVEDLDPLAWADLIDLYRRNMTRRGATAHRFAGEVGPASRNCWRPMGVRHDRLGGRGAIERAGVTAGSAPRRPVGRRRRQGSAAGRPRSLAI